METEVELKVKLAEMEIAQLLSTFPESRAVLFNHFGASCFECPASNEETVALGVSVHSADSECFFNDLIKVIHGSQSLDEASETGTGEGVEKVDQNAS